MHWWCWALSDEVFSRDLERLRQACEEAGVLDDFGKGYVRRLLGGRPRRNTRYARVCILDESLLSFKLTRSDIFSPGMLHFLTGVSCIAVFEKYPSIVLVCR